MIINYSITSISFSCLYFLKTLNILNYHIFTLFLRSLWVKMCVICNNLSINDRHLNCNCMVFMILVFGDAFLIQWQILTTRIGYWLHLDGFWVNDIRPLCLGQRLSNWQNITMHMHIRVDMYIGLISCDWGCVSLVIVG